MGLFKKFPCPVCGTPTGKFLATKIEGQPLCVDCGAKVLYLPSGMETKNMSVDEVKEFISFYDGNADLRGSFQETYRRSFGFLGGTLLLDIPQRLMRFKEGKDAVVFEASDILSFCISEDDTPLFEGTKEELVCYQSTVPDRVRKLGPEIDSYLRDLRQYEQMEQMERMLREKAEREGKEYSSSTYLTSPDVGRLNPFWKFYLKIELGNPLRTNETYTLGAPGFSSYDPSIMGYLSDYEKSVKDLREIADQLMAVLNPDAPERQVAAQLPEDPAVTAAAAAASAAAAAVARAMPAAAAVADPVAEIQKYKGLLDSGIITEEEFTAKKRQLLGI